MPRQNELIFPMVLSSGRQEDQVVVVVVVAAVEVVRVQVHPVPRAQVPLNRSSRCQLRRRARRAARVLPVPQALRPPQAAVVAAAVVDHRVRALQQPLVFRVNQSATSTEKYV